MPTAVRLLPSASELTIVDEAGIDPDRVHLPGIFVQRVVALTPDEAAGKRIEKRTTRPRDDDSRPETSVGVGI